MKRGCSHPTADNQPWMKHDGWWQRWDGRNSNSWVIADNFTCELSRHGNDQLTAITAGRCTACLILSHRTSPESEVRGWNHQPDSNKLLRSRSLWDSDYQTIENPFIKRKLSWRVFVPLIKTFIFLEVTDWILWPNSKAMLSDKERYQCLKKSSSVRSEYECFIEL